MARKRGKKPASASRPSPRPGKQPQGSAEVQAAIQAAVARLNQGDVQGAAGAIQRGLQLAPEHPDLLHLGGQVAAHLGDPEQGKAMIRRAIKLAPKMGIYHYNLGSLLLVEGDLDAAKSCLQNAIRCDGALTDAYTNLALIYIRKEQHEVAEPLFREAVKRQPDNPDLLLNLAICNLELGHLEDAERSVAAAVAAATQPNAAFLREIGNCYRTLGRHLQAEDNYRRAIAKDERYAPAWFALAEVLSDAGDYVGAEEVLNKAQSIDPENTAASLSIMARVLVNRGDIAEARELLDKAANEAGQDKSTLTNVARQYKLIGDFDAQARCLDRVLQIDPKDTRALANMMIAPGRELEADDVAWLRRVANDRQCDRQTRSLVSFALGDYYRYQEKYDEAFGFFRHGNELKRLRFDRLGHTVWVEQMQRVFSTRFCEERADWGSDSRLPVLIVGLPRSGTTLVEQILSAHPLVHGAGEYGTVSSLARATGLPEPDLVLRPELVETLNQEAVAKYAQAYLDRISRLAENGEVFVTNKLPGNFLQLGLFALLFPRAPVIHVEREPRDNLLSIYFNDFAGRHDYAYDLKDLGHYYGLYERLMAHWISVIPNPVLPMQYESLIDDLPGKAEAMADFLGIVFDERMLRFYEQQRKVETASLWQVRQPLYSSSVARWKPYEKHLKPLLDILEGAG